MAKKRDGRTANGKLKTKIEHLENVIRALKEDVETANKNADSFQRSKDAYYSEASQLKVRLRAAEERAMRVEDELLSILRAAVSTKGMIMQALPAANKL